MATPPVDAAPFDLLAIAAHPDDAELGCGGALAQAAGTGARVAVIDLTLGERASRGTPALRRAERDAASAILGLGGRFDLHLPDAAITALPEPREQLAALLRRLRPKVVLAPYWEDRHPDHAAAGRLAREACFAAGLRGADAAPPFRPERVFHYMLHHPFEPSFVLDISAQWERKQAAIRAYASQFGHGEGVATALSGPGFLRMIEARAIHYGSMIGVPHGEPFRAPGPLAATVVPGLDVPHRAPGELPPYAMS
ncbi:bacillithiol biosynthesis deacetylase BshB1 [Roseicella aquatilis]|uniref:Bacillithiol biosynthesis deacetylase BshB1 n=1 Tax=Roseicella aquatilis TaxID=2527868 RepID=A0A4R4D3G8_9PROT|nr:bacillithiol biosynthesis deacetylase BshB1 [Roseicella aquatilis]TCZ54234.1 bacillithiol biosynthesis deacetylase BshB1 [Roseicella aquatilis]